MTGSLRIAALLAVGLAGFAAVAGAVQRAVPWPAVLDLRWKVESYLRQADAFDLVFLGSSRLQSGISPLAFDAALAERGTVLKSFNLAVGGMGMFELDYLIGRLLDRGRTRPCWLVVEWQEWDVGEVQGNSILSERSVYWHDLEHTLLALEGVRRKPWSLRERWPLARDHLAALALKWSSHGRGPETVRWLVQRALGRRAGPSRPIYDERGYAARDEGRESERHVARSPQQWSRLLSTIDEVNGGPDNAARFNFPALRRQIGRIAGAGITPIFLVPPVVKPTPLAYQFEAEGLLPALAGFNRPAVYPDLYDIRAHPDVDHLNHLGAERLSRTFADWFAARALGR